MKKSIKRITYISIALISVISLLFLLIGPFSWQVTDYKSLGLTDHGFSKVPILGFTATEDGETMSTTVGMLPKYSAWLFDDDFKVTKAAFFISLGLNRDEDNKDNMDSQTITVPPVKKGVTVTGYLLPQYEEYVVYQQRKWRSEETVECHVYRPILPLFILEYSDQPNVTP